MNHPKTHLTRHEDGNYSVMHDGMPLTRPQSLDICKRYIKQFKNSAQFNKLNNSIPVWDAKTLEYDNKNIPLT